MTAEESTRLRLDAEVRPMSANDIRAGYRHRPEDLIDGAVPGCWCHACRPSPDGEHR